MSYPEVGVTHTSFEKSIIGVLCGGPGRLSCKKEPPDDSRSRASPSRPAPIQARLFFNIVLGFVLFIELDLGPDVLRVNTGIFQYIVSHL
jgi:hypothetical protein